MQLAARTRAVKLEVPSTSSPKTYTMWVGPDGEPIFCDCPGHRFARHGVRAICVHMQNFQGTKAQAMAIAFLEGVTPKEPNMDRNIRFIEIQELDNDGSWVGIGVDLSPFNREVM